MNQEQEQGIQPAPQPTMWGFDHTADGQFVVVIKQTHGGTAVDFISTANATGIWQALREQTKQALRAQSGVVVPPKLILGPDGQAIHMVPPSPDVAEMEERQQAIADAAAEQAAVNEVLGSEEQPPA